MVHSGKLVDDAKTKMMKTVSETHKKNLNKNVSEKSKKKHQDFPSKYILYDFKYTSNQNSKQL